MMKKKKNKKTALILVLVLLISAGYAALASNLKINGSSKVNAAKWNVYWDNIQITEGSVPADNDHKARITDSGKTQVEFSIELNEPGDYYEFTVDAVNNGTIDAMIASEGIVNGVYSDANYQNEVTLPKTVSYTVTYADGTTIESKHLLAKKNGNTPTTETYKVRIEYKNDDSINPGDLNNTTDQTYYFKFSVNYVQADDTKIARSGVNPAPTNPYLTIEDNGDFLYKTYSMFNGGDTWLATIDEEDFSKFYLRTDEIIEEVCYPFNNTILHSPVCVTPASYNSNYSEEDNYESDFENCFDEINEEWISETYDGTGTTCVKGYAKAKADEMLSKGASYCESDGSSISCRKDIDVETNHFYYCFINDSGYVGCGDSDTEIMIGS